MSFFKIADSFSHAAQRVSPIDNRHNLSRVKKLFQENQILLVHLRNKVTKLLAPDQGQKQGQKWFLSHGSESCSASGSDTNSVPAQSAPVIEDRTICVRGKNQIVMPPVLREIFSRIVDHMISAKRFRSIQITRAAHGSDLSSEGLGNLNCKSANAAGCAIDENLLSRLDVSLVAQALKGSERRYRDGRRSLERKAGRLQHHLIFFGAHILRKGPAAPSEDCITRLELGYIPADGFQHPGHINTQPDNFRLAQPEHQADEQRFASHEVPVERID